MKPQNQGSYLITQDRHQVFYITKGNPNGIALLVVHGGPGAGCGKAMLDFFDLKKYFVILVDQRGCGKSTPHASLENNTTEHLIQDFENIRKQLGIKQWLLFGGSWGSTLSLVYAIKHPSAITGLILRGVFLATQEENDWLMQSGASKMSPLAWHEFTKPLSKKEQQNILAAYHKHLTQPSIKQQHLWAKRLALWEASISCLKTSKKFIQEFSKPKSSLALARIEVHFLYHRCFLSENFILQNLKNIAHLPIIIVQGAYDLVCPPNAAYQLAASHPAKLIMTQAGHCAHEPQTKKALIKILQTWPTINY